MACQADFQGGGVEFQLLGPMRVSCGDVGINVGVRKQRFVLAVLALEANRLVPVDRLIDLAWPDAPPASARGIIHGHISGLRAVLPPGGAVRDGGPGRAGVGAVRYGVSVRREGSGYLLACDPMNVDAHRFTELATRAMAEPDLGRRLGLLDEALGLWRGPALTGTVAEPVRNLLC